MSHYYLARYHGAGTVADPFRPVGDDVPGWAAIDLRPDSTVLAGLCLLAFPIRDDRPGAIYLGDDHAARLPLPVRTALGNALGVTLSDSSLASVIAELLMVHAREDRTRWRPLRATHNRFEVWLGELVWAAPVIAGGASLAETFSTADSATLGPQLTWTDLVGDWRVVSGEAKAVSVVSGAAIARAETDLSTADHEASAEIRIPQSTGCGVMCRKDSTATLTFYHANIRSTSNDVRLFKVVASTQTQLGSNVGITFAWPDRVGVGAVGSTIGARHNNGVRITVTDTAIPSNLRCGLIGTLNAVLASFVAYDVNPHHRRRPKRPPSRR